MPLARREFLFRCCLDRTNPCGIRASEREAPKRNAMDGALVQRLAESVLECTQRGESKCESCELRLFRSLLLWS
jgi:hypothetical protein